MVLEICMDFTINSFFIESATKCFATALLCYWLCVRLGLQVLHARDNEQENIAEDATYMDSGEVSATKKLGSVS